MKENAPGLLRRALGRLVVVGHDQIDPQPDQRKFQVSRHMLEVCLDLGFPVSVLSRSPLVGRDLDLLQEINARAPSVVFFGVIYAPDSVHRERVRQMQNVAPRPEKCFAAMEQIAHASTLTGTCTMPILLGAIGIAFEADGIPSQAQDRHGLD